MIRGSAPRKGLGWFTVLVACHHVDDIVVDQAHLEDCQRNYLAGE